MTWIATLTGKRVEYGRVWIEVTYTQDDVTHVKTHNLTSTDPKYIKRVLQSDVNQFDSVDPLEFDYLLGSSIDIAPDPVIPPDPPTQDEIDEAAWLADWRQLNQMQQVLTNIPALDIPARQTILTDLQTSLAAGWKNSYLGKIR